MHLVTKIPYLCFFVQLFSRQLQNLLVINFITYFFSLVIRGEANDSAVLCTDCSTYDIKNASTSNTLILFDDLSCPDAAASQSDDLFPESEEQRFVEKKVCLMLLCTGML